MRIGAYRIGPPPALLRNAMKQSENMPASFLRLLYLQIPLVIIVLAASGACWAVRLRRPALAWTAWIMGWLVLSVGITGLGAGYLPLLQSVGFGILASGGAVLAAILIVPWQEQPVRHWSWSRWATWLGRAAFGVLIASIMLPILHEFFSILLEIS